MKKWLLSAGICFAASASANDAFQWENALTLESVHNLSGGIKKGSADLANLDLTLAVDTQAAGWWDSGEFFFYVLGDYGHDPAELTGGVQGISNIAADNAIKIYEFWYQHKFFDDQLKLLTGLQDFNSTFYALESASLFNHPSFGIGPDTSQATPSIFPTTAWTLHATLEVDKFYLIAAVYDGVPGDPENPRGTHIKFDSGDGTFQSVESGLISENEYKIGMGYWHHTAETENPIDASLMDSNSGFYLIAEQYLTESIAVFIQFGKADDATNQIEEYWGGGIVYSNLIREGDALGLSIARATNGDPFLQVNPDLLETETAYELSYAIPITESISTQASLYRIENPDMDPKIDTATAAGVRLNIAF